MKKAHLLASFCSLSSRVFFLIFSFLITFSSFAADRYWVATTSSNWNNADNWASSPGGSSGASVPSQFDKAVFGAAAGFSGDCLLDMDVKVIELVVNGNYSGKLIQGASTFFIGAGGATLLGGDFTGGTADITVLGNLTINGTNFTSTKAVLRVGTGSDFYFSSGSFVHNSGTVLLNAGRDKSITGDLTFNNLIIYNEFGPYSYYIGNGSKLVINGTLSFSGKSSTDLNVYPSAANPGIIEVKGDIVVTSTSEGGGGTATLLVNGTGTQTIYGNAATTPGKLPRVQINKTSGQLNLSGTVVVGNDWTYIAGVVNPGTSRMVFSGNLTITGTLAFNEVEFNAVYGHYVVVIASGTELTANGNLYFSGRSSVTLNTGVIHAKKDINVSITSIYGGGNATILIDGNNDQTITGSGISDVGRLPGITINKNSGTLHFASIITVAGNWTYQRGTLDIGTSRIVYSGNSITITGSISLNDVEFTSNNYTGGTYIYMPAGSTLTVTGHTYFTGGTNPISLESGIIEAKGDITTSNISDWTGGKAILLINGTGSQLFTGEGVPNKGSLPHVLIDKPSGDLKMAGVITVMGDWTYNTGTVDPGTSNICFLRDKNNMDRMVDAQGPGGIMHFYDVTIGDISMRILNGDINIDHRLALEVGRVDLNGHTCYMNWSSPAAITRNTGYIISEKVDNTSKLNWRIGSVTGAYIYPFGTTAGVFIPFKFELTEGDAGTVTVSTYHTNASNIPYPVSPDAVNNMKWGAFADFSSYVVDRFWQIDKSGASGTATVTYTYAPADVSADVVGSLGILHAQRYNKVSKTWENPRPGQTANSAAYNVTEPGVTLFSPRMLAVHAIVLPVTLTDFIAVYNNKVVNVKWSTTSEVNHDHFVVERSVDGRNFSIVTIKKGSGNSNSTLTYSCFDERPLEGVSYYRLKIVDINGYFTYSKVVKVNSKASPALMLNSIVHGTLVVSITGIKKNEWIGIYDMSGKMVYKKLYDGSNWLELDVSTWRRGMYTITIGKEQRRFVIP